MIETVGHFFSGPISDWLPKLTVIFFLAFRPWRQYEPRGSLASIFGRFYLAWLMAALIFPNLLTSPIYWFLLAGIHFLWLAASYVVADNHRYLEGYWILAIAIALTSGVDAAQVLKWNGQILIGLCFFFAVLWKILSPSYRDGSFFIYTLVFETRFLPIALWVGGLSPEIQHQHQYARGRVSTGQTILDQAPVSPRLRHTGLFLAWWAIAIEALLAVLFLCPVPGLDVWRVSGLGLFVVSTYVLAPVPTFGYILLLMLAAVVEGSHLRVAVLGLALAVFGATELAHLLERIAIRQMAAKWKEAATPHFSWTRRAEGGCLQRDGQSSWRLAFPSVGVSLYTKAEWAESLQQLLRVKQPFSWNELLKVAPGIPAKDLNELMTILTQMKLLNYSSPLGERR